MGVYPLWKYILVILVLSFSFVYSLPNIYDSYPAIEIKAIESSLEKKDKNSFTEIFKTQKIEFVNVTETDGVLQYVFNDIDDQLNAYESLSKLNKNISITMSTFSSVPEWLKSLGAYPMFLGLDLKGGVHFLLQVDKENIMTNMIREIELDVKKHLIINKYRYNFMHQGKEMLIIEFNNQAPIPKIIESIKQEFPELIINQEKSKDIIALNITPTTSAIDLDMKSALVKNLSILRTRVDELGVAQPILQQQGKDRIIIQLPGLHDSTRAKSILGSTATLEFRLTRGTTQDWIDSQSKGKSTINSAVLYKHRNGNPTLLSRKVIVSGKDIRDANAGFDGTTNTPSVFVRLGDYGASRMLETTSKNVGNKMAELIKNSETKIISNCGHMIIFEKAFEMRKIVKEFILGIRK